MNRQTGEQFKIIMSKVGNTSSSEDVSTGSGSTTIAFFTAGFLHRLISSAGFVLRHSSISRSYLSLSCSTRSSYFLFSSAPMSRHFSPWGREMSFGKKMKKQLKLELIQLRFVQFSRVYKTVRADAT